MVCTPPVSQVTDRRDLLGFPGAVRFEGTGDPAIVARVSPHTPYRTELALSARRTCQVAFRDKAAYKCQAWILHTAVSFNFYLRPNCRKPRRPYANGCFCCSGSIPLRAGWPGLKSLSWNVEHLHGPTFNGLLWFGGTMNKTSGIGLY